MTIQEKRRLMGMTLIIVALIIGVCAGVGSIVLAIATAGTATKFMTLLFGFSGLFALGISAASLPRAINERILYKLYVNGKLNILDTPISFL